MSNFVIECPVCGKPIKAGVGLFAKKSVKCSCGYNVVADTEKMAKKRCPHCGNDVIYDRSKSGSAKCPVCHEAINAYNKTVKFTCPSCKKELMADKNADVFTCPQCNQRINIQARVAQEESSKKASLITWDQAQNDVFIYRHPVENFNIGSRLIVREGQKAIFFKNGKGLDLFGPGEYTLETQRLPLLDDIYKLPVDSKVAFSSNVYFIRSNPLNVKWGVPEIRLRNPGMNFYVEIGMSGSFELQVKDDDESARTLLYRIIGTSSGFKHDEPLGGGEIYSAKYISEKFSDIFSTRIADLMSNILIENNINILDVETKKIAISNILREDINNNIFAGYGLTVLPNMFNVSRIMIHNNEDVEKWKAQEAERVLKVREENVLQAEAEAAQGRKIVEETTEAKKKIIRTQGEGEAIKITGQARAEAYTAQAMAEAEEMRAKGYTYQQETSRQIGLEAMQNGLPGTGNGGSPNDGGMGGVVGGMVGLGVGLGTMGSVVKMTKDIINPIIGDVGNKSDSTVADFSASKRVSAWNCQCGTNCITSKFCPNCGKERPESAHSDYWDCDCGCKNIKSRYCPDCGNPKPEQTNSLAWNCSCGCKNIRTNFCPDCGNKKGE